MAQIQRDIGTHALENGGKIKVNLSTGRKGERMEVEGGDGH